MGWAAKTFLQKKHLFFCKEATPGFGEIYSSTVRVHDNYPIEPVYNVGVVSCGYPKKKKENAFMCMIQNVPC